jgi:hypothetical protein
VIFRRKYRKSNIATSRRCDWCVLCQSEREIRFQACFCSRESLLWVNTFISSNENEPQPWSRQCDIGGGGMSTVLPERKKNEEAQSMAPRLYHRSIAFFLVACMYNYCALWYCSHRVLWIQLNECNGLSGNCVGNFCDTRCLALHPSCAVAFVGLYFAGLADKKSKRISIRYCRECIGHFEMPE